MNCIGQRNEPETERRAGRTTNCTSSVSLVNTGEVATIVKLPMRPLARDAIALTGTRILAARR